MTWATTSTHKQPNNRTTEQNGTASIERVMSFFLSGGAYGGDNDDGDANGRRQGERGDHRRGGGGGGYTSNDGGESDEVLEDAREKLSEGLGLGATAKPEKKLSPRRLFEYLDADGTGEVWHETPLCTKKGVINKKACLFLLL